MVLGVDIVEEEDVDKILGPVVKKELPGRRKMLAQATRNPAEAKAEDTEAPPTWDTGSTTALWPEPLIESSDTYGKGTAGV